MGVTSRIDSANGDARRHHRIYPSPIAHHPSPITWVYGHSNVTAPLPIRSLSFPHAFRPVLALARASAFAPEGARDRRRALLAGGSLPVDGGGGDAAVDRVVVAPLGKPAAPGDTRGGLRAGAA